MWNGADGEDLRVFFVNTDAKSNQGHSYHDAWIERGVAVTSGPSQFADKLARLRRDEVVLMYANGLGVVAAGTVTGDGVETTRDVISPNECCEYHLGVNWDLDLRQAPIRPEEIRRVLGQTPLQTVQRVIKGVEAIAQLLRQRQGRE